MLRSILTVAACSVVLAGCSSDGKKADMSTSADPAMGVLNSECPVMGGAVNPGAETVAYHGYNIGFCCNGCVGAWEKMDDAAKEAFVAKYTQ